MGSCTVRNTSTKYIICFRTTPPTLLNHTVTDPPALILSHLIIKTPSRLATASQGRLAASVAELLTSMPDCRG